MLSQALPVALLSAAVFGGLSLMSDRPRGRSSRRHPRGGGGARLHRDRGSGRHRGPAARTHRGFGVGLMAAAVAGMLYHLYLGRFDQVWTARGVFLLVYLVVSAAFGLIFLSLI
jgi:hypothetical protein